MSDRRLTSRRAVAIELGFDPTYISRLAREGVLPVHGGNRLLDADECAVIMAEISNPMTAHPGHNLPATPEAPPQPGKQSGAYATLNDARKAHEAAKAALAELKLEAEAGRLVDRNAVEQEAYDAGRAVRAAFQSLGGRLRDRLAGEDDPVAIHQIIDAVVDDILTELAETGDVVGQGLTKAKPGTKAA